MNTHLPSQTYASTITKHGKTSKILYFGSLVFQHCKQLFNENDATRTQQKLSHACVNNKIHISISKREHNVNLGND